MLFKLHVRCNLLASWSGCYAMVRRLLTVGEVISKSDDAEAFDFRDLPKSRYLLLKVALLGCICDTRFEFSSQRVFRWQNRS